MIGIDANILLRHLLDDDPKWSSRASLFLRDFCSPARPGYVNLITLAEVAWVLRRQASYNREKLALVIESLLTDENLVVAAHEAVATALDAFRNGPAGFADCLVAELNARAEASPTYTIDRDASKQTLFVAMP